MSGRETWLRDSVVLPRDAFVAAFLYYIGITLAVIGGTDFSATMMIAMYGAAPAVAAAVICSRLIRASAGALGRVLISSPAAPLAVTQH